MAVFTFVAAETPSNERGKIDRDVQWAIPKVRARRRALLRNRPIFADKALIRPASALGLQLKARDTHVVPGDAAKAAGSFEDEIMVRCPAHHFPSYFRSTIELVRASREFNRLLAFSVAAGPIERPL
jgi:hypothetical protein